MRAAWGASLRGATVAQYVGVAFVAFLAIGGAFGLARRTMRTWGTTEQLRRQQLAGDALVPDPVLRMDLAVDIAAAPPDIWPWLLQLGNGRGGLYSYDWLDRLFGFLDQPSANRILPEFQHLEPGDAIPLGRGPEWPVVSVVHESSLVLGSAKPEFSFSWEFALLPGPGGTTTLLSRNCGSAPRGWKSWLIFAWLEPAAFIMTRRMLLNLKARAERLAAGREDAEELDRVYQEPTGTTQTAVPGRQGSPFS